MSDADAQDQLPPGAPLVTFRPPLTRRAQLERELAVALLEPETPAPYCVHGCGAVVVDAELHQLWHTQVARLVDQVAELGQLVLQVTELAELRASPNPGKW